MHFPHLPCLVRSFALLPIASTFTFSQFAHAQEPSPGSTAEPAAETDAPSAEPEPEPTEAAAAVDVDAPPAPTEESAAPTPVASVATPDLEAEPSPAPPATADAPEPVAAPPPPGPYKNSSGGFLDFNFYPLLTEVDADSVFTLNAFAKLPYGFSYFSLLNIANQPDKDPFADTSGYYTEQNLRFTPSDVVPLDLTVQYNMRGGEDNDRLRFGFRWRLENTPLLDAVFSPIYLSYSINFHVLQIDHEDKYAWQMEHVAKLSTPYLDNRLYLAGFADHTFNTEVPPNVPKAPVVLEVQLGLRLVEELYAIAEYRINQYRVDNEDNLAIGAQYVAKW